ncbi:hypothetical protein I4F81_008236 [Pyropia yezoensis]|uniref:Uncharacterized protein n=1 Tax=Pyropia yezoensis TaxID=2788 RepID=A0ACC3C676_PYRYE|nr:hypothetical protein I4F81_008236 [Neopyropia yezoensis]
MGEDHESRMAALEQVKAGNLTTAAFARRFELSYNKARYFILNDGQSTKRGPQPFFTAEEEQVLVKFIRINAIIGRGLSRDAFLRVCGEYVCSLSAERQATARRYFRGSTTPGRGFLTTFLRRWPELREYRAGTIEEGRARNARPETVAHWFATLAVMYRDLRIVSPRQLWNMDETHIKARESAGSSRARILGPVGLRKPEVVMPDFASGAGACTAAFTVSAAGLVAPHFVVVEGATPGHAFVRVTRPDGTPKVRSRVRELALECHAQGRAFTTIELVKAIGRAASDALTVDALKSAFQRVGVWPLDPAVVRWEDMCKGADAPLAPDVDIPLLVSRLAPVARKDMVRPVVQNGTLSTAGRATVLTAPEVISALREMDAAKEDKRNEAQASKRAREERAAEKSVKDEERARAKQARIDDKAARARRETCAVVAAEAATEAGCWLRCIGHAPPSAAKARRRLAAARVRAPILAPRAAWAQASREAARMAVFSSRR